MNTKDSPLSKQELFVHPISIMEKQKAKNAEVNQSTNAPYQLNSEVETQNFNHLLLNAIDSQTDNFQGSNNKKKHIFKSQASLTPDQIKQKHYRTRMCPQGLDCKKRLVCRFAHTQYQLRRPYKNRKNPCVRYQKGLCNLGAACPDYHGNMDLKKKNYKYKVEKCTEWKEKGTCSKGKLCIYIHDEDQIREESSQSVSDGQIIDRQEQNPASHYEQNHEDKNKENPNICKDQQSKNAENAIKIQAKDIFSTNAQRKKTIIAKQVVQQPIDIKQQQVNSSPNQEQNFNIQFNF